VNWCRHGPPDAKPGSLQWDPQGGGTVIEEARRGNYVDLYQVLRECAGGWGAGGAMVKTLKELGVSRGGLGDPEGIGEAMTWVGKTGKD